MVGGREQEEPKKSEAGGGGIPGERHGGSGTEEIIDADKRMACGLRKV